MSSGFQRQEKLVVGTGVAPIASASESVTRTTYTTPTGFAGISAKVVSIHADQSGDAFDFTLGSTSAGHVFGTSNRAQALELSVASSGAATLQTFAGDLTVDCGANSAVFASDVKLGSATISKSANTITLTLPSVTSTLVSDAGTQSVGGDKTFTGTISVPTPTLGAHATTKTYVDGLQQNDDFKQSVRLASTANLPLTGVVPLVIDGVTAADGDRVLLKNQSTASENGIYTVGISGTYTLTRATDANTSAKVTTGLFVIAEEGAQVGRGFVLTTPAPIVLDTTSLTFTLFNPASSSYTAGDGLQLIGNEFSADSTIVRTSGAQSVGGVKTFTSAPVAPSYTATATTNQLLLGTTNTTTISATAPTASRVYTIADVGADATFVMTEGAQTINGAKTFSNTTYLNGDVYFNDVGNNTYITAAAGQFFLYAGTRIGFDAEYVDVNGNLILGEGTVYFRGTVDSTNYTRLKENTSGPLTAPNTITVPDLTGDIVVTGGTQTIGGVKTFSSAPVAPSYTATATTNQLLLGTTNIATISATAPAASRVYTIADPGADATFVMTEGAQTINGVKTFNNDTYLKGDVYFNDPNDETYFTASLGNIFLYAGIRVGFEADRVEVGGNLILSDSSGNATYFKGTPDVGSNYTRLKAQASPAVTPNTITVPDLTGDIVVTGGTQTIGGAKTFSDNVSIANEKYLTFVSAVNPGGNDAYIWFADDDTFYIEARYIGIQSVNEIALTAGTYVAVGSGSGELRAANAIFTSGPSNSTVISPQNNSVIKITGTGTSYIDSVLPHQFEGGVYFGAPTDLDWTKLVSGTLSGQNTITVPALTGDIVVTGGAQTITGVKTFTTAPVFPTLTATNTSNQILLGTTNTITINAAAPSASRVFTITDPGSDASFMLTAGPQTITGVKTVDDDVEFQLGTEGAYIKYISGNNDFDIVGVDAISLSTTNPAGVIEVERGLAVLDTITVGSYAKFYTDNTTDATLKNLSGTLILDSNDFIRAAKSLYAQGGITVGGSSAATDYTLINGTASGANTITAPAITGDMVITAGVQTISGQKSFTANKTYFGNAYSYLQDAAPGLAIISDDTGTPANGLIYVFASNYIELDAPAKINDGLWFGVPSAANSTKLDAAGGVGAAKTVLIPFISGTVVVDAGTQTIGGDKTFNGTITVPTPTASGHAATKSYVDSVSSGIKFRDPCRVASTANLSLTGAVPLVIDGVTIANGNRILLKNQTLSEFNGIYDAAIAGTYTLTRSADASGAELEAGIYTFVSEGSTNGGYSFVLITPNPITEDVTPLDFAVFSQAQSYTAGNGLQLSSGQFSVAATVATTNFEATGYVQTPQIQATTVGGAVYFNNSDITGVNDLSADTVTVPIINATGPTTIGNNSAVTTIDGSRVDLTGPTVVDQTLRINADTDQFALGTDAVNHLHISANTSGFAAVKTYDIPISSNATAHFAIIEGSAPGSTGYVLASTGTDHLAQWVQSAPITSVKTTVNTAVLTTTPLVTVATATGRCYIATIDVVARRGDNGSILTYTSKVPVKNVGGTVTVGTALTFSYAYDSAGFAGTEIGVIASGTNFVINTTPTNLASTNWTTRVSYDFAD